MYRDNPTNGGGDGGDDDNNNVSPHLLKCFTTEATPIVGKL
jgi:hypothetical protein